MDAQRGRGCVLEQRKVGAAVHGVRQDVRVAQGYQNPGGAPEPRVQEARAVHVLVQARQHQLGVAKVGQRVVQALRRRLAPALAALQRLLFVLARLVTHAHAPHWQRQNAIPESRHLSQRFNRHAVGELNMSVLDLCRLEQAA